MNVILYSTDCPKCSVLAKKLDAANIKYETNKSVDDMLALGIMSAPVLSVDGKLLQFKEAVEWVNEQGLSDR